jgi:hypothetical protein
MIRERVLAGLARARQEGTHLGRRFTEDTEGGKRKIKAALAMRANGVGIRKIAREVGLGVRDRAAGDGQLIRTVAGDGQMPTACALPRQLGGPT